MRIGAKYRVTSGDRNAAKGHAIIAEFARFSIPDASSPDASVNLSEPTG